MGGEVHNLDWRALLDVVPECDALITDCPYSERTHAEHDDGTMSTRRARDVASRKLDLVVDPCCGAGTTLVAALRSGRRAIGGDVLAEHAELARLWTANPHLSAPRGERQKGAQPSLFGGLP